MAEKLAQFDVDVPKLVLDGTTYRRVLRAESTYDCAAGEIQVMRTLYRHAAEPAIVPMELDAGIVEGHWTPWAARQMVVMTSLLPPRAGENVFAELGLMAPSKSSLDRLPKAMNPVWGRTGRPSSSSCAKRKRFPQGR